MTNIPKPHVVFRATSFQMADQWHDQEERQKWHKDVVVLFQENAWVNARTHIHGLCEVLGPINELLGNENSNMKGLVIEDNLFSHKTESVENFGAKDLKNFSLPVYVPPNMTSFLQVVDRHIGIRYKYYVYLMYRKEMVKHLNEIMNSSSTDSNVDVQKLTPAEKQILIKMLLVLFMKNSASLMHSSVISMQLVHGSLLIIWLAMSLAM